ncbi:MAG: DNA adenine methylase [Pyrinomonadaceae bacterium]
MDNPTSAGNKRRTDRITEHDQRLRPFLKWAGGKRQLVSTIREFVPQQYNIYFEPFVGAGAVLFNLQPHDALINDANEELINCYRVVRDEPSKLIQHARRHRNTKSYFYRLRSLDRTPQFETTSPVERAARIIFLNKTCFNGLFRVNSHGHFNVPYCKYLNPRIVDEMAINAISRYFNTANIQMTNDDFEEALSGAAEGDFVYLDPPYDPVSNTSSFTGYNLPGFDRKEQKRLKSVCDDLTRRGCYLLMSNSATEFIRSLYSNTRRYTIVEVSAHRNINSVSSGRGKIKELLIFNNYNIQKSPKAPPARNLRNLA